MINFLSLFTIFCSSSVFEVLLSVLVPIILVAACMTFLGVILHGKFI